MNRLITLFWFLGMSIIFGAYSWGQKIPVSHDTLTIKENFFGTTIEDPFRYFENINDSRVEQYSKLQDQKAEAHFKTLPSAKKLFLYPDLLKHQKLFLNEQYGRKTLKQ